MMSKFTSKISQNATYLRVFEDGRMLYGDEVINTIHALEAEISALRAQLESERECSDRNDRNNFDLLSEAGKEIEVLRARVESKWISVGDSEPCTDKIYWHTHIKSDGTFTDVYRGGYLSAFKRMGGGGISHAFTHYCESITPKHPELMESEK